MNPKNLFNLVPKIISLFLAIFLGLKPGIFKDARAQVSGLHLSEESRNTNILGNSQIPPQVLLCGSFGAEIIESDISSDNQATYSMAVGDIDNDGDLDVAAGKNEIPMRLYQNNGSADPFKGVSGVDITEDTYETNEMVLGDMDDDGDLDLVTQHDGAPNRLYLNNGTSSPFNGVIGSNITSDYYGPIDLALGDMDGDGDLDLVVLNFYMWPSRLYLNNGTANPFNGIGGTNIATNTGFATSMELGDMDGDGHLDLVIGNANNVENSHNHNQLYLNNGTSDPFNGVIGRDISTDAYDSESIAVGDLNGDGQLDIVAGNTLQPSRLYLNNGTADPFNGVNGSDITSDALSVSSLSLGDIDGDGDLDLLASSWGVERLYLNNGSADPFAGVIGCDITTGADKTSVVLADMDGDEDLDIVIAYSNQQNRLYQLRKIDLYSVFLPLIGK
jgi:hypothetical protein